MASGIYDKFKEHMLKGTHDLSTDVIRVALMDNSHSFSSTDETWSDVSANEITGTGYTADGEVLANQAVTIAATSKFDADDVTWTLSSLSAYHAVLYNATRSNQLIASIDFGSVQTTVEGSFVISWDSSGIITL